MTRIRLLGALVASAVLWLGCAGWPGFDPPEVAAWRAQAAELRGLAFRRRVPLRWIDRAALAPLVRAEIEAMLGAGEAGEYRDALVAFGLLPPGIDLVELQVQLTQQEIAGFYSVRERVMYVLAPGPVLEVEPIVIHELVHALQHQHFPRTLELMQALRRNDDVTLALGSAAEGDASLTMLRAAHPQARLSPESALRLEAGLRSDWNEPRGLLGQVPRIMRMSLLFPYLAGFQLAEREYRTAEQAGLDGMLRDAPLSTLRVRRPEARQAVAFLRLPVERAAELAGPGCRAGVDNVAGVVGIEALFADHGAPGASEAFEPSWSGDRFLHVVCPAGPELLWITQWTTAEAAAQFAAAYAGIAESVARVAPLAGVPRAVARGREVLVATPRLAAADGDLLRLSEVRAYASFAEWIEGDCFPESPCPSRR